MKAAVIFTKMMTEPSSLVLWALIPPQVDISKVEGPVEHDQKSTLTVVLDFSIDRTDEKTQTINLHLLRSFLSLSPYIYIQQIMLYT